MDKIQIKDRSAVIFGNPIDSATLAKAEKQKKKFLAKYGDDSDTQYQYDFEEVVALEGCSWCQERKACLSAVLLEVVCPWGSLIHLAPSP